LKPTINESEASVRGWSLVGLGVAAITACFLITGTQGSAIVGFYSGRLSPPMFACWLIGIVVATLCSPACAFFFWWGAKRFRFGWILHLLLVPTIYAIIQVSIALMLFGAGEPDTDSLSGWALVPATLLFLVSPVVYFAALGMRNLNRLRR
jgi:hypothetical protein